MSEVLVLLTLNFPEPLVERLRALSPRLQIRVHPARTGQDLPGDLLADVEVLYTLHALPEPASVPNLRWVQFHLSGVDAIVDHPLLHTDVLITSLSGASAPQLAEYALMGMLALGRRVPRMVADKAARRWAEDRFERFRPVELRGATVGMEAPAARSPVCAGHAGRRFWPSSATCARSTITATGSRTWATQVPTWPSACTRRRPWRRWRRCATSW
jgi:hypothetical protein